MDNIILIGLPGAGKSTVGVILAKTLGMNFIDTDILIQGRTGMRLQEIIDTGGIEAFLQIEQDTICSLHCTNTVVATGGSVVLKKPSMEYLKKNGRIVYLKITFEEMVQRLSNMTTRGIVFVQGQSLPDMYHQRVCLYERYAEVIIDNSHNDIERVIRNIIRSFP